MAITIENYTTNIIQSLYYFLNYETYTKNSVTQTLKQHFSDPQLDIILGFPQSLQQLILPTIALVAQPVGEKDSTTFRDQYDTLVYSYNIYGFCGSEQSYEANQKQRDKLCGDLRTLLEETEFINIYEVADTPIAANFVTPITDVEVISVTSQNLPPTGVLIADRYRFLIELKIVYVRSIATG